MTVDKIIAATNDIIETLPETEREHAHAALQSLLKQRGEALEASHFSSPEAQEETAEVMAKPRETSKTEAAQVMAQEPAQLSLYQTKALQQIEAVRSLKKGAGKDSPASGSKALKTTATVTGKTKAGSKTPSAKASSSKKQALEMGSETKLLRGDAVQSSRRERAGEAAAESGSKTQEKTSKLAVKPKVHSKTPAASRMESEAEALQECADVAQRSSRKHAGKDAPVSDSSSSWLGSATVLAGVWSLGSNMAFQVG